jgi:hypothetical protein
MCMRRELITNSFKHIHIHIYICIYMRRKSEQATMTYQEMNEPRDSIVFSLYNCIPLIRLKYEIVRRLAINLRQVFEGVICLAKMLGFV